MEKAPIRWAMNDMPKTGDSWLPVMSAEEVGKVRAFHESFPQYEPTPLASMHHAAKRLGVPQRNAGGEPA